MKDYSWYFYTIAFYSVVFILTITLSDLIFFCEDSSSFLLVIVLFTWILFTVWISVFTSSMPHIEKEISFVDVFITVNNLTFAMFKISEEFTFIYWTIFVLKTSLAIFTVSIKISIIYRSIKFLERPLTMIIILGTIY